MRKSLPGPVPVRYTPRMNSKLCLSGLGAVFLFGTAALAQVVPTTPTRFAKRNVGSSSVANGTVSESGTGSANAGVASAKVEPMVRTTTYIVLSGARQWTSSEGKPMLAKLIAFEEVTTETSSKDATAAANAQPVITQKPTVIRDGKVRFLMDRKAYEVALDKLSPADQDFIKTMKRAVEATK